MAGSSSIIPASNQSGFFFTRLPKVVMAELYMASQMWLHLSSVLLSGQSLRASSMALAKHVQTSGTDVRAVLIRGRPFCLESWICLG